MAIANLTKSISVFGRLHRKGTGILPQAIEKGEYIFLRTVFIFIDQNPQANSYSESGKARNLPTDVALYKLF